MKNIKECREKLSVSQRKLSAITGISTFKISSHECGYKHLTEAEVDKLFKALDTIKMGMVEIGTGGNNEDSQQ